MRFLLKRYLYGISVRRRLFLLIPLALFVFLCLTALAPTSYTVTQAIRIGQQTPLAVPSSPVDSQNVSELLAQPAGFFTSALALTDLERKFEQLGYHGIDATSLRAMLTGELHLETPSKDRLVVSWKGRNPEIGQILVAYFSQQILERAAEGGRRVARLNTGPRPSLPVPQLNGEPRIETNRMLWDNSRTKNALITVFFSTLAVLFLFAVLEWSDPAFKSERQVGRYLGVPVLGSLPDLREIAGRIDSARE